LQIDLGDGLSHTVTVVMKQEAWVRDEAEPLASSLTFSETGAERVRMKVEATDDSDSI
jgi:hypothetical protein